MTVPYWVKDAVFYQIFPDRFANGDPSNDPANVQTWDAPPTRTGFKGGDLRGVIQHFDYLLDLGINAIYFNPIFQDASNHHYHTVDYFKIDPRLGDQGDFKALLDLAHNNHVRVILDGVFNHCGRGFFAFNDILENGAESGFKDWYHVKKFPVDAYTPGDAVDYEGWWKMKALPKFNTDHPAVRKYLLGVARYWIEQGADGWRLDVPNEINDDSFWAEFRQVVLAANPDAYILGEIWNAEKRWLDDAHFDGLMNYPIRTAILDFLTGKAPASRVNSQYEELIRLYPHDNLFALYNTLGSHDTERLLTRLGGDVGKLKLAFLYLFGLPGAPAVYYGDEIGMTGGKDPECRGGFPWDESRWNKEIRGWVRQLIGLRRESNVLRRGEYRSLTTEDGRKSLAYGRVLGNEAAVIALNAGPAPQSLTVHVGELGLADGRVLLDRTGKDGFAVSNGTVEMTLDAWSGRLLM